MSCRNVQIASGEVRHKRLTPKLHTFRYPALFVRLDALEHEGRVVGSSLFGINRRALMGVHLADHGDGSGTLDWLRAVLADAGLPAANGVTLQTFPRVFGYGFSPVSFWFCHHDRADSGQQCHPFAIVAEVHNTFGERHCYLLADPTRRALPNGAPLECVKTFHVSPFNPVSGHYRFRFVERDDRCCARIDYQDNNATVLQTSISGQLVPLRNVTVMRQLLRYPAFALMVTVRIHWQALRLLLRGLPFFGKPEAPASFVTRGTP